MTLLSILGLITLGIILLRLFNKLGQSLPVIELLLAIAGLQWILGPIISYSSEVSHYKYYMYVPQETYMSFVVPAFVIFSAVALLWKKEIFTFDEADLSKYSGYGLKILLFGIAADIAGRFAPQSLAFFLFLLSQFKFIGAALLLFSSSKKERLLFYAAIGYLFVTSIYNALFHDFLLWSTFYFMLWALKYKPGVQKKIFILLAGLVFVISLQTAKAALRAEIWNGYEGDKIALFFNVLDQELSNTNFDDTEQEGLNVRLNQGWIISAIMKEVPEEEPFADGATVKEAVTASLLPRFLSPNKKKAGGQENFMKYTGLHLGKNTSMGMSIIGEAYANFGSFGGIFFMLIWGFFLSVYWNRIKALSENHPVLIFFIPLLFFQVVKAETELVVVLNHMVKASIVVALFFWAARKQLKWDI
ncbi:O-antigen polysaccharide polymerase Wzy [Autumnicola psychrophila]|uniref:O-antigen polysaccharide polymerase Wzy n=1 Tax=Autumnicola psychrophila TaxID=3075592 RepID=A0ABU3DNI0_9FLAO|nr:O-antigen polysaccharide polymerase Wzy [Zunongwangia sp. F225]MDT0685251.1 O-antigen polysaccharide polymerase Wzy [Zunongwangia sp. F225]